jgi:hypothetical protein
MKAKAKKRGVPSLAAAKHLRTLFESAAVRQKAHDASLALQKRLRDHNIAIQQHTEALRLRDMTRGDTALAARVARGMMGPRDGTRPRSRTPPRRAIRTQGAPGDRTQRYELTPPPTARPKRPPRVAMDVDGMRPRT